MAGGLTALLAGGFLVLPACSDSSGPGSGIRDARAVVYGTVTGNGEPAADVEVTVTPYGSSCEQVLLGGAEPSVTTGSDGGYRVVIEREIVGTSVTICPVVAFEPLPASGFASRDTVAEDRLFDLRAVDAGIGVDSVAVNADLTP